MSRNLPAKLSSLTLLQWWYVFRAMFGVPLLAMRLRKNGIGLASKCLGINSDAGVMSSRQLERAREIARAVDMVAARWPLENRCIVKSMLLIRYLDKAGISAELKLGVPSNVKSQVKFEAHAWVEMGGRVVNDRPDIGERFTPFVSSSTS